MWARAIEILLGVWLLLTFTLFEHAASWRALADGISGAAVIALALLSLRTASRHAHLGSLGVGLWLIACGRFSEGAPTAGQQNEIVVGLLLLMFALVPSPASLPPPDWWERTMSTDKREQCEQTPGAARRTLKRG